MVPNGQQGTGGLSYLHPSRLGLMKKATKDKRCGPVPTRRGKYRQVGWVGLKGKLETRQGEGGGGEQKTGKDPKQDPPKQRGGRRVNRLRGFSKNNKLAGQKGGETAAMKTRLWDGAAVKAVCQGKTSTETRS